MKKQFLLLTLLTLFLSRLPGQGHQPVFPELDGQDLFEAVSTAYRPTFVLSYGEARDILFGTIYKTNDSLRCIYTNWPVYLAPGADPTEAAFQNGAGINTEHAWPQTFGASVEPARANMHNLFPTRADVNGDRGNLPFGDSPDNLTDRWYYLNQEMTNPPATNRDAYSEYWQNTLFEPREVFKGNLARALMYFYTIYRPEATAAGGASFFNSQRGTLCQWHAQDPVDADEWRRTFLIAGYQDGKANPFVLDCTLAARVYCPELVGNECIVVSSTDNRQALPLAASISPNPARAQSQLAVESPAAGTLLVSYFDGQGRLVQAEQLDVMAGTTQLTVQWPYAGYWYCQLQLQAGGKRYERALSALVLP